MKTASAETFAEWRTAARALLQQEISPENVLWSDSTDTSALPGLPTVEAPQPPSHYKISRQFLRLAQTVGYFRSPDRWSLLYRVLWRLTHGEPHLLHVSIDDDVRRMELMQKAIRRDIHKMHAFVRFREFDDRWVAWHVPEHYIVEAAAPFFVRRFANMKWSLLTPDRCAHWDGKELTFTKGASRDDAPASDAKEELWKTYYRSIFNPARIKLHAMKKEMPVHHWPTLPETQLIPELLRNAGARVKEMRQLAPTSAAPFIPVDHSYESLKKASLGCQGCELYEDATQTVFGEGNLNAQIVLLGEVPGDQEDREGRPFIGPAGALLNRGLALAGLNRSDLYVTNTVKHFRFIWKAGRRFHQKPSGNQMHACWPWLTAELNLVKPKVVICLGVTAAQAIFGRLVKLSDERGKIHHQLGLGEVVVALHPSAILRLPAEFQEEEFARFVADLQLGKSAVPKSVQ